MHDTAYNRILSPTDLREFDFELDDLWKHAPDVMHRKVPEALINQAFTWHAIQRYAPENIPILGVGIHEDPVFELLRKRRYAVVGIDPAIPGSEDLGTHWAEEALHRNTGTYACIFACSVLEHVIDDSLFMRHVHDLLLPGGVGIFTFDFHPDYKDGDPLPRTNRRFYTQDTVISRLLRPSQCEPVDVPFYGDAKLDFRYDDVSYTFASLVIRKRRKESSL